MPGQAGSCLWQSRIFPSGVRPSAVPQAGPHPVLLLYGETWNGRGSLPFRTMRQNPLWALVVVLNEGLFLFGPGPRQWNILESHAILTELARHPMGHFKSTDFTVDILSDLHS